MIANRFTLFLAIICFVTGHAAAQEYNLHNKFEQGQTSYLKTQITMKGTSHIGENKMPLNMKIDTMMSFETVELGDDNSVATIEIGLHKLEMQDAMMGNQKLNLIDMLGMKQKPIQLQVNKYGRTLDNKTLNNIEIPGMSALGQTNTTTKLPWPKLPTQAVTVNQTWKDEQVIPLQGADDTVTKHMTYTLQKIEERDQGRVAVISIESNIDANDVTMNPNLKSAKGNTVDFQYTFREYKAKGTGLMEFNMDTGKLLSNYESQDWVIDMGGEVNVDQADFPSNFRMEYVMETKSNFFDTHPEAEQ